MAFTGPDRMARRGFEVRGRSLRALVLLLACGVLGAMQARAAVFAELYSVTVTPAPDALDRRAEAIQLGMSQLLTRVTGRLDARFHPDLLPLIESAETHMRSYNPLDRERVRVEFIPSRVDQWLETLGWPVWGAERPMTLLWVAVDGGWGERAILSAGLVDPAAVRDGRMSPEMLELLQAVAEELRLAADERGLPITLPSMDRLDVESISFVDLWGGFEERIERASNRYPVEAHLVVRVSVSDVGVSEVGFNVRSTLVHDDSRRVITSTDLRDGLDWLANDFASEFSMAGGLRSFPLTVRGIGSLADYGAVLTYLEALSVLDSVEVEALGGRVLDVRLTTRSEEDVLRRVLALDGVLLPADAGDGGDGDADSGSDTGALPSPGELPQLPQTDSLTYRLAPPGIGP